jgi:uncharacterized membrane protein
LPFCTHCGTSVDPYASFCHNCGAAQPHPTARASDFLEGLSDRTASILCYIPVFGVIPAIIFLASQKYRANQRVRFNAFQALYLFVAWLIVSSAAPAFFVAGFPGWGIERAIFGLLKVALFVCWIYLLVKAAHREQVKLPIVGDLAARSTTEQL